MNNSKSILPVKKLLSLLNTNPYSKTYGCFDRDFWHYKTLRDFPSAPYQQGVLSLALIYKNDFPGNKFYKNEKILTLIDAGIDYWCSIQNRDGSFNEWFPNEHSQVATAFTTYAVTESILRLKDELKLSPVVPEKVKKAGGWLCNNPDYLVTNHAVGALMALYNIYLLTKEEKYLEGAKEQLDIISKNQNDEGWFLEYDGCDLGYLSVTVDFLTKYYRKSEDETVLPVLEKAIKFMSYFVHPDGTYGGEYGSRNTKYRFGSVNEDVFSAVDDRYSIFFFLPNYLEGSLGLNLDRTPEFFEKDFSEAGIYVKKNDKYHIVLSYKKGGVVKVFSVPEKKLLYADTGYVIESDKGVLYSQNQNGGVDFKIDKNEGGADISLEQKFSFWKESYPLKKFLIPFRLFNYIFGWSGRFMSVFNKKMKDRMILKSKLSDLKLERRFEIKENYIKIEDRTINKSGMKILSQKKVNDISFRHVPSSRFFRANDFFFTPENSSIVTINF